MNERPTNIKEVINWFTLKNIIDFATDKIEVGITLLSSLLKLFSMFHLCFWYGNEHDDQNIV